MNSSTAFPALTMSMIFRGGFNLAAISSSERTPTTRVPLAGPFTNSSTLETVLL